MPGSKFIITLIFFLCLQSSRGHAQPRDLQVVSCMIRIWNLCIVCVMLMASGIETKAQSGDLEVGAFTFSVTPRAGTPSGHSRTGHKIEAVYGDLKSTLFLFRQGNNKLCLLTSPLGVERDVLREVSVAELSHILGIPQEAVVTNSSHNHTIPFVDVGNKQSPEQGSPELLSWELGQAYMAGLRKAVNFVQKNLKPVSVEWGKAEETRITYNRKGRRPDGTTYFVREEDRLEIEGEGYHGLIDPEAIVVLFKDKDKKAVAALTFFTGHPVAAYNPEKLISYGQFPQEASEKLSQYLGGVPVGFVQGCAGNINAKHMLTGTMEQARQLGEKLGASFIVAARAVQPSKRTGLDWSRETVNIPLSELPDPDELEKELDSIDDFIRRGNAGDENTLSCVGMNFPRALTAPYRAKLVELVRPWYVWALDQHRTKNTKNLPKHLPVEIVVARFGDVGFIGLPFEPFVETGLRIKKEASLPCVLTCGYTDGRYGYIPDASGVNDREYMSGHFRYGAINRSYTQVAGKAPEVGQKFFTPPYKAPGADACVGVAVKKIREFSR